MCKLTLFQPCNHLLYFVMKKLAGVFFEDGYCSLGRWRVKKKDCCHVLSKRLRYAGELLGQNLYNDAGVARKKSEIDNLPRPPFHVF